MIAPRILMPMPRRVWSPSDEHGHFPVHRWCVRARVNDGAIVRELWFDDRDEADAFLWSRITGTPWPHYEELEYPAQWSILVFVTLTTTSGSNQTYNVPPDYVTAGSVWNVIAGGGSGCSGSTSAIGLGGAAAAFSRSTNVVLTPSGTATWFLGPLAAGVTGGLNGGNAGADCWFSGANLAASAVGAKGGAGGSTASGSSAPGGLASAGVASGTGFIKFSGGNGGASSIAVAAGGGGAAGPNGNGAAPAANSALGAAADAGFGGAGGNASAGGNGSELAAGVGSGGGGAGRNAGAAAFAGGLYGGGGGSSTGSGASGAGAQGVVYGTYVGAGGSGLRYNMPMMGI